MCGVNMGGLLGLKADFEVVDKLLRRARTQEKNVCSQGMRESFQFDREGRTSFVGKVLRWTKGH